MNIKLTLSLRKDWTFMPGLIIPVKHTPDINSNKHAKILQAKPSGLLSGSIK